VDLAQFWQERYPSLFCLLEELLRRIESLPESERGKFWLCRVLQRLALFPGHFIAQVLSKLNNIAAELPKGAQDTSLLKSKFSRCVPDGATLHREHYDSQLLDTFAEMMGYDYLRQEGYAAVHFLAEGKKPRPDLEASGGPRLKPVVMECKNLHNSDEQKDYLAHHEGEARSVDYRLVSGDSAENPLLRKLRDMALRAADQLCTYDPLQYRRILFLNYVLDIPVLLIEDQFPDSVDFLFRSVASELRQRQIELVVIDRYGLGETEELCRA